MMKQPPFVTKLRISKLCRGIIALAVIKLCILAALVADIPLPELRWGTSPSQQGQQNAQATDKPSSSTLVLGNPERSLLAASAPANAQGEQQTPSSTLVGAARSPSTLADASVRSGEAQGTAQSAAQSYGPQGAAQNYEPQGSAAAAAAARLRPMASRAALTMPASSLTKEKEDSPAATSAGANAAPSFANTFASSAISTTPAPASPMVTAAATQAVPAATPVAEAAPLLSTGVEGQSKNPDEASWWHNMLQLTSLPVPQLGVSQVAHAASLDTPPAPAVPPAGSASPFTPPSQQIMRGQDAGGNPLPPRSTTARPLPAGSSGLPQNTSPVPANSMDAMATPVSPPAPNVRSYSPPEDPNRKQQELARREQEILALKQQMDQRLKDLENAEARMKGMIKDATDVESKKVSSLIAVYANMKPKQAAQTLQSLDERVAVKILTGLTPKQAGEILSYADPKITAKLTELMTRMQMQP